MPAVPPDSSDRRDEGCLSAIHLRALCALERITRRNHRTPHVGNRGIVKSETVLRLPEMPANHVLEIVDVDDGVRIESIRIIHRDKPARHVPFVPTLGEHSLGADSPHRSSGHKPRDMSIRRIRRESSAAPDGDEPPN